MRGESGCAEHTLSVASPLYKGWVRPLKGLLVLPENKKKNKKEGTAQGVRLCRISNYGCFFTKKDYSEYSAWTVTHSVRVETYCL